jgi:hypothetical protein
VSLSKEVYVHQVIAVGSLVIQALNIILWSAFQVNLKAKQSLVLGFHKNSFTFLTTIKGLSKAFIVTSVGVTADLYSTHSLFHHSLVMSTHHNLTSTSVQSVFSQYIQTLIAGFIIVKLVLFQRKSVLKTNFWSI